MFVVKTSSIQVPQGVVLSEEGQKIFDLFKMYAEESEDDANRLCLVPLDYKDSPEDILEEGKYTFYSENPVATEMFEILDELWKIARPITFVMEDLLNFAS